jgi:hypothetical protein
MFDTSTGPFLSTGLRGDTNTAETQMRRVSIIDKQAEQEVQAREQFPIKIN